MSTPMPGAPVSSLAGINPPTNRALPSSGESASVHVIYGWALLDLVLFSWDVQVLVLVQTAEDVYLIF